MTGVVHMNILKAIDKIRPGRAEARLDAFS